MMFLMIGTEARMSSGVASLVRRECLVAECLAVVERHTDVRGLLLGEYLVERVHEAHNS